MKTRKRRGFKLIELLGVMAVMAIVIVVVGGMFRGSSSGSIPAADRSYSPKGNPTAGEISELPAGNEKTLRQAKVIRVKEKAMSLGKDYYLFVDGKHVATISGKNVRLVGGDVFTLKIVGGKVLATEEECKRYLKLDRTAIVYKGDGTSFGYFGERAWGDTFKRGYIFHFYDKDKKEFGRSQKIGKSSWNRHKLQDNQGNNDYDVDKKTVLVGGDEYILTRMDMDSSIPLEFALFIVCIEDAIADAN